MSYLDTNSDPSPKSTHKLTLDRSQFSFVGYRNPESIFKSRGRPYQVIREWPGITSFENAAYIPKTEKNDGCLYDKMNQKIDDTCIFRETNDVMKNFEPRSIKLSLDSTEVYEGSAIYLGFISKHYGHFLIESLARAWALIKSDLTDLPVLVHAKDASIFEIPYIKRVFEILNINPNRLLFFNRPTRVRQIFIPTASIQVNSHVYDAFKETMQHIARSTCPNIGSTTDQPLYISRTAYQERLRKHFGEVEVEAFIQDRGGRIFHPQLHSIDEQIRAFNHHKIIIGVNGSAMHNIAFAMSPVHSIQLAGSHISPTYLLIDACCGIQATYCRSIEDAPVGLGESFVRYATKAYNRLTQVPPFGVLRRFGRPFRKANNKVDHANAIRYLTELNIFS